MPLTPAERQKRHRARGIMTAARLRGELVPEPCAVCGKEPTHGHHYDGYDDPLKVVWLCAMHHGEAHGSRPGQRFFWAAQRARLGIPLRKLAEKSGVAASYLSLMEQGRGIPTGEEYDRIVAALDRLEKEQTA